MKQEVRGGDWTTVGAFGLSFVINLAMVFWYGGKLDERLINNEAQVKALQAKSEIDASQNTQIAVLSTQLGQIQSTVSEIKATVTREKK